MPDVNTIPVIGIDTPAWITNFFPRNGEEIFFVGNGVASQRFNFPSTALTLRCTEDIDETVELEFAVELVSGLSDEESIQRSLEHILACGRCAFNVRVVQGKPFLNRRCPLIIEGGIIREPLRDVFRVKLNVETITELANLYCGRLDKIVTPDNLFFKKGSSLTVVNDIETSVLVIESVLEDSVYEVSCYSIGARFSSRVGRLEMPTFDSPLLIGEIVT